MDKNSNSYDDIFVLNDRYVLLDDILALDPGKMLELDLGCGKGDFAVALAARHPERNVLAADVMIGRLRKVLRKARRDGVENLNFLRVEARHLMGIILPDSSVDRLHILCPDPWPKERHRGNRLLSSDFMMQIARVLKKDAFFHFASDDEPYLALALRNLRESGLFVQVSTEHIADVADVKTEFERRWIKLGKTVTHTVWQVQK